MTQFLRLRHLYKHQQSEQELGWVSVSLDSFVSQRNISKLDFIKADIEGMERDFLFGAKETIKKFRPCLALCIYHRPDDPEVIEKIIRDFEPQYKIIKTKTKIFAYYGKFREN